MAGNGQLPWSGSELGSRLDGQVAVLADVFGLGTLPHMVRMEVADAAVDEIMATTFGVPVKRLILIKGLGHQDGLEEISHRIREPDPDVMTDEQYAAELARLRAGRERLKALPAEPGPVGTSSSPGSCTPASTRLSRLGTRRVAEVARVS